MKRRTRITRRELLPALTVCTLPFEVLASVLIGSPLPMVSTLCMALLTAVVLGPAAPEAIEASS